MSTQPIFSRRHLLQSLGAGTVAVAVGRAAHASPAAPCLPVTNVTRGPFFVDTLNDPNIDDDMKRIDALIPQRSDLRADSQGSAGVQAGTPLALTLLINDVSTGACRPLADARVDLWHCNAQGIYSDVFDGRGEDYTGQDFLRGYQFSDSAGKVAFMTVVPGWYPGRAVHMHLKIRLFQGERITSEATTQLFFDDTACTQIFARDLAYNSSGAGRVFNGADMLYQQETSKLMLDLSADRGGYAALLSLAIHRGELFGG